MSEVTNTTYTPSIEWDGTGERFYHAGVNHGVLYVMGDNGYGAPVPWNGLTSVEESPDGADPTDLWADNIKYASFRSAENYKGAISAYMYPPEFEECNGAILAKTGMKIGQQKRKTFGFCYRTEIGSDADPEAGYILHVVYGATVSPSSSTHDTINDNPDAVEFSWDFECVPVAVENISGIEQTCVVEINSVEVNNESKMNAVMALLYDGTTMPTPDQIYAVL